MADEAKKDGWDKFGVLVPLIVGLAVAGVGGWFTYSSNQNQLQLNRIQALDKLRPLLTSPKSDERTFGYSAFSALGFESLAIRMIQANADESGRPLLVEAGKSGTPEIKAQAKTAIASLNSAAKPDKRAASTLPTPLLRAFAEVLVAEVPLVQQKALDAVRQAYQHQLEQQKEGLRRNGHSEEEIAGMTAPSPGVTRAQQAGEVSAKSRVPPDLQAQIQELLKYLDNSGLAQNGEYMKKRNDVGYQCFQGGLVQTDCAGALLALKDQIK